MTALPKLATFESLEGFHSTDEQADLARATDTVDRALAGKGQWFIERNRDTMIRNELPFARFEREQREFRRRHGLARRKIGRVG